MEVYFKIPSYFTNIVPKIELSFIIILFFQFQELAFANPMRSQKFSDFLSRERQALSRRRQIFGLKTPTYLPPLRNLNENLIASASELSECKNATFSTEADLEKAGFDLSQCVSTTNEKCSENCQCEIVEDKVCDQGQSCSEQICEQIEQEVCDGQNSIPDQVTNLFLPYLCAIQN